jgi:hypothetical protein
LGFVEDRFEPRRILPEEPQNLRHTDVIFRELDGLRGLQSDSKIQPSSCVRVQDCAITHSAPRMLPPDSIGAEVEANSDGIALALEPEKCRIPMTLIPAATLDADFSVSKWRRCVGDHLKVRVFDEVYVYSTDAKELISQSGSG